MTESNGYFEQLQKSAILLRLQIPDLVSKTVIEKITLALKLKNFDLPHSIKYTKCFDENIFHSLDYLARFKSIGWHIELVRAVKNYSGEEVIIALINKEGSTRKKTSTSDRRNGNNAIRAMATRR